ncbi:MAG: AsmA-like C-terminal domain-containing protein, partial [Sulfurimonas sp.]
DILNFQYYGIKSTRSNTAFKLQYKDNIFSAKSFDDVYLNVVNSDVTISNLALEFKKNNLYIKNPILSFGKFTQTRVYARYDFEKQQAHFSLNDLKIKNPKTGKTIFSKNKVLLNASVNNNNLKIESRESRSSFNLNSERWSLQLRALENLYRNSDLMKKYHIDNGEIEFYKKLTDSTTHFKAKINYPYKLIIQNGKPLKEYDIIGKIDGRYAVYDFCNVQYHDKILTAQLQHQNGKAGFKLEDQKFHLYGEGFGDQFMEKLFIFSKFKDGKFAFNIDGNLDKFSGTFLIEKSTLMDYVLLNNVLAFINTVPSLVTFSVPGYSKNGLYMNHAYLKFGYEKGIFNIDEMYMDSKELKIFANGKADIKNDTIDMNMNLK